MLSFFEIVEGAPRAAGLAEADVPGDNGDGKRNITLRAALRLKQVLYLSAGRLELYSVGQKGDSAKLTDHSHRSNICRATFCSVGDLTVAA
jgi:hypothetical protein